MHTGGRGLFFDGDEVDQIHATTNSNIAISGASGSGFAGAASAMFGAGTKSQYIQAEGKIKICLHCVWKNWERKTGKERLGKVGTL